MTYAQPRTIQAFNGGGDGHVESEGEQRLAIVFKLFGKSSKEQRSYIYGRPNTGPAHVAVVGRSPPKYVSYKCAIGKIYFENIENLWTILVIEFSRNTCSTILLIYYRFGDGPNTD